MAEGDAFAVDLVALRELSGWLAGFAERAGRQGEVLGGVRAETGRADSDDAGRSGPGAVAELVAALRDALRGDGDQVEQSAAHYGDTDLRIDESLRSLGRLPGGLA
ncbi:hypothetical protein AB0425_29865 [Actinosynnema sp. NPDC051121]